MKYNRKLFIYSLAICISSIVSAETISFRAISTSGPIEKIYYETLNGDINELKCNDILRTSLHRIEKSSNLEFFRLVESPDQSDDIRIPVGSVSWPNSGSPYLLVVHKEAEKIYFQAVEDSTENFPMGSIKLINGSLYKVLVNIGNASKIIDPGMNDVLRMPQENSDRGVFVDISAIFPNNTTKKVYSNLWNSSKNMRTFVFLHNTGNARRPIGFLRIHESAQQFERTLNSNQSSSAQHQ